MAKIRINILYAPPPDGRDDASATYASRAADFFSSKAKEDAITITIGHVGPLIAVDAGGSSGSGDCDEGVLPWEIPDAAAAVTEASGEDEAVCALAIFLISCAADGSVDRSVRKITRKIPKAGSTRDNAKKDGGSTACNRRYAVAALGHARCENSAIQMGDTIFGTARRFDKALGASGLFGTGAAIIKRLETQVELRGPEVEFDPWLNVLRRNVPERLLL